VDRPGTELAISRSLVRRPNHYTTEPKIIAAQFLMANDALIHIAHESTLFTAVLLRGAGFLELTVASLAV